MKNKAMKGKKTIFCAFLGIAEISKFPAFTQFDDTMKK